MMLLNIFVVVATLLVPCRAEFVRPALSADKLVKSLAVIGDVTNNIGDLASSITTENGLTSVPV